MSIGPIGNFPPPFNNPIGQNKDSPSAATIKQEIGGFLNSVNGTLQQITDLLSQCTPGSANIPIDTAQKIVGLLQPFMAEYQELEEEAKNLKSPLSPGDVSSVYDNFSKLAANIGVVYEYAGAVAKGTCPTGTGDLNSFEIYIDHVATASGDTQAALDLVPS